MDEERGRWVLILPATSPRVLAARWLHRLAARIDPVSPYELLARHCGIPAGVSYEQYMKMQTAIRAVEEGER
jgi:hypothetical protein